jgi:hypothetical protein
MPFRLRRDTREWFQRVEGNFDLDFDMYYLCLLAGLTAGQKTSVPNDQTTELVDSYPGDYKSEGRLITSLFLSRELKNQAVDLSNRKELNDRISELVDSLSPSRLTTEGMKEMNKYSYGGFDVILEWFDDRPYALEDFLPHYYRHLRQAEAQRRESDVQVNS